MPPCKTAIASALGFSLLLGASVSQAAFTTYTSRSVFDTALAALGLAPVVHDFDDEAAGPITLGNTYDGITFDTASIVGGDLSIGEFPPAPPTTTNPNSIGTGNAANQFQMLDGSTFSFSFPASYALGLYVISTEVIEIGDFVLSFGGQTVANSNVGIPVQAQDQFAYFLGIIDDSATYSSGSFNAPANGQADLLFIMDDFVTAATPLPATLGLLGLGLVDRKSVV